MNLHAEALLHCVLASREDEGHQWVHEMLSIVEDPFFPGKSLYPVIGDIIDIGNEIDFGYILPLPDKIIIAVSGTIGPLFLSKAWRDNMRIVPENGLHRGWGHGWEDGFQDQLNFILRGKSECRPLKFFGLSRGGSVSQIGGLYAREVRSYPKVEHIGFNQPKTTNKRGCARMKAAKLCSTRWYNPGFVRDPVDDLGVIGGKHYGLSMKLPDPPNTIPVMDHDYTNTCDALSIQMSQWGKPVEADLCASLKRFCKSI